MPSVIELGYFFLIDSATTWEHIKFFCYHICIKKVSDVNMVVTKNKEKQGRSFKGKNGEGIIVPKLRQTSAVPEHECQSMNNGVWMNYPFILLHSCSGIIHYSYRLPECEWHSMNVGVWMPEYECQSMNARIIVTVKKLIHNWTNRIKDPLVMVATFKKKLTK